MKRSFFAASLLATGVAGISVKRAGAQMMCGMMGAGSGDSGADMRTVMQLFSNHNLIRRHVEVVHGGIRATTESDDQRVATLLQSHVASMYRRVDEGRRFTMMSRTLPTLFTNAARYRRVLRLTPHGVSVTETSSDSKLAEVIRAHGREVSAFVTDGMRAMMRDMMGGD